MAWLIVLLAGCSIEPLDLDLASHLPYADLYDDGAALRITGCSSGAFLGCAPPGPAETMTVGIDGQVLEIPQSTTGQLPDQLLGLFRDGPFQLTTTPPASGRLALAVGDGSAVVQLPEAFAVAAPTGSVSRAAGPVTITHGLLPDGTTQGLIVTTCDGAQRTDLVDESTPGELVIDLAAQVPMGAGRCTHELHVDQTVPLPASLAVTAIRIVVVELASEP